MREDHSWRRVRAKRTSTRKLNVPVKYGRGVIYMMTENMGHMNQYGQKHEARPTPPGTRVAKGKALRTKAGRRVP